MRREQGPRARRPGTPSQNVTRSTRRSRQNRCSSGLSLPPSWTLLRKPSASRWNRRWHGTTPKKAKFTYFSTCFGAASRYQQGRWSTETTRDLSRDLRRERRDAMRKNSCIGLSRSTREARRLTRVATNDAESRFERRLSMLFDMAVDPAPRCMFFWGSSSADAMYRNAMKLYALRDSVKPTVAPGTPRLCLNL